MTTRKLKSGTKKEVVYNVRIVEDKTKKSFKLVQIISIIIFTLMIYLVLNGNELYISIVKDKNFWDVFRKTVKELIYATGFSFLVFIVLFISDIANKKKK